MPNKRITFSLIILFAIIIFLISFIPTFLLWSGALDYTKGTTEVWGTTLYEWHSIYLRAKDISIAILAILIVIHDSLKGYKIFSVVNFGILLSALTNDLPLMIPLRFILSCVLISSYTVIVLRKFKKHTVTKAFLVIAFILSVLYWIVSRISLL